MRNQNMVLFHLFSALAECRKACARTRALVMKAIERYLALAAA